MAASTTAWVPHSTSPTSRTCGNAPCPRPYAALLAWASTLGRVDRVGVEAPAATAPGSRAIPASSGKITRHRLNRGGNRQANWALYLIAVGRMAWHGPTRAYVERRTKEGKSKAEIIRCLKRHIARELYGVLVSRPAT